MVCEYTLACHSRVILIEYVSAEANTRADLIYGPIIERRQKVDKVRSTISVLQRYKFFFNLPSSLLESIKQHKSETAIRDYRKGKYLYHDLQKEDDKVDGSEEESNISELHRKVFEKVWTEVNKIVVELRSVLLKMLEDPWRSMEEQEKTIKYVTMNPRLIGSHMIFLYSFLFDLDTTEDPAWFYLDSQYRWIMGLLKETFENGVKKIDILRTSNDTTESDSQRSLALKKAIGQIQTKSFDSSAGKLYS